MLNWVYLRLQPISTARNIWVLGIASLLFFLSFNVIMLPERLAGFLGYSGEPRLFLIDLGFNYSSSWVYTILANYGEQGRTSYLVMVLLFDFIFPLTYSFFLATSLTALLRRLVSSTQSVWLGLGLSGFLVGLADWLENLGIIGLLVAYPQQLDGLVAFTNFLTIAKAGLLGLNLTILLGGLCALWLRRKDAKAKTTDSPA